MCVQEFPREQQRGTRSTEVASMYLFCSFDYLILCIHIIYIKIELANKEDSLSYDLALTSPSSGETDEPSHESIIVHIFFRLTTGDKTFNLS